MSIVYWYMTGFLLSMGIFVNEYLSKDQDNDYEFTRGEWILTVGVFLVGWWWITLALIIIIALGYYEARSRKVLRKKEKHKKVDIQEYRPIKITQRRK